MAEHDKPFYLAPDTEVEVIRRLLKVGVPPTAIANAFEMDAQPITDVATAMRREQYGTAELSEMNSFLTWVSGEKLLRMIQFGSPDVAFRAISMVMGKSLGITARQTPEELINARVELAKLSEAIDIADDDSELEEAAYEHIRGQYVLAEIEDGDIDSDD